LDYIDWEWVFGMPGNRMTHVVSVLIFLVAAAPTTRIFAANWKMSQFISFLCLIGFCLEKLLASPPAKAEHILVA